MFDGLLDLTDAYRSDTALVAQLLDEALALLERDRAAARRRIEDAFALVRTPRAVAPPKKGTLAGWQVRRAVRYIQDNLGSQLRVGEVAKVTDLSASYFSRAFKTTTGTSYSEYVIRARLNYAKRLLLTSDYSISEIALTCGLSDQSHLTRLFSRAEGLPPRAWRRRLLHNMQERVQERHHTA